MDSEEQHEEQGSVEDSEQPDRPGERFVVLLRHGIAEEAAPGQSDEDRELTAEGAMKMNDIARGLHELLPKVRVVYASPLVRAVQTAQRLQKRYGKKLALATTDALRPGTDPSEAMEIVRSSSDRRIILVGHEPHLTTTMLTWTGMREVEGLTLKKGGCYGIRISGSDIALEWMLPPRVLRRVRG